MVKISFTFDDGAGVNAMDPVGDLIISDGRSDVVVKTTYLDSWLEALIRAYKRVRAEEHVTVRVPEEPQPILIDGLPDGRLTITRSGKAVLAEAPEALEAALKAVSRSFLDAIQELPETSRNKIIDPIRQFATSPRAGPDSEKLRQARWGLARTLLFGRDGGPSPQQQAQTAASPAANNCRVYRYYSGLANPATCATPAQASSGNNGNVMGYFYQDTSNPSLGHTATFTYDNVNRLATAVSTGGLAYNQSYGIGSGGYDQYGNGGCKSGSTGLCTSIGFNSSNNRVSSIAGVSTSYDAAGNMISDGVYAYTWDPDGRLRWISPSANPGLNYAVSWYNYDALGERVDSDNVTYGTRSEYLYGIEGNIIASYDVGTATWQAQSLFVAGRMFAIYQPGPAQTQFVHVDHLGSCASTTNQAGNLTQDMLWGAWGQIYSSAPTCSWYAGTPNDILSPNLYFNPNREYASGFQRWFTPDPENAGADPSNPQTWNMYAYAGNNPTTNTDPTGELYCGPADENSTSNCVLDEEYFKEQRSVQGLYVL
jgi:RHS repeat-associated protein